ncbi:BcII family subclass B1 metallo-beta-lactamase [Hymenobacter glaciei]|uniref:beta-lactamase n=1 Tax=Hymenobacter glaciei TaxID=877209 RepID=A0ABP7UGV1_9BACT
MRPVILMLTCFLLSGSLFKQQANANLKITRLTGDFYIYTTYNYYKGNRTPANGLYLLTNKGAVIIDTPWDSTQFQPLLDSIWARHHQKVVLCLATHFHEDRTGGLAYYRQQGIRTYTTRQTDMLSQKRGMKRAQFLLTKDTTFTVGQHSFQTYFPGHGHAPDNIVVWFKKERVLYGGCLIKSMEDNSLGNMGDASVKDYAQTVANVQRTYKNPTYVIPGHNDWTNPESVSHTLTMARQLQQKP